jgi:glycosyltransferase involved in cell wall biosynthesis
MLNLTPQDEKLQEIVTLVGEKADRYEAMLTKYNEIKDLDLLSMQTELAQLPKEFQNAPMFVNLRNKHFPKTDSSGKEIVFMCGYTEREWTPDSLKEGIGGSEEAIIHLSRNLAAAGYDVTVYNNCGHETQVFDGVTYKPFYTWNYRDKTDTIILWRHPKLADYDINANKILLDLHDVISPHEFTEKRLKKIDHVFVKSEFHKSLFPNVPSEKFVVIQNGINYNSLQVKVKRDPMLIVNTSSPDRSLSSLIRIFSKIKEQVPEAKCKWAYGWGVYDTVHKDNPEVMEWKRRMIQEMEAAGIENLDRVSHEEVAKLYNQAHVFLYPTEFAEIDCISARKAQAGGAVPITTDFAALKETVRHGVKLKSPKNKDNWNAPGQFDFGVSDPKLEEKFVDAVVAELRTGYTKDREMADDMKQFDWVEISKVWEHYAKN